MNHSIQVVGLGGSAIVQLTQTAVFLAMSFPGAHIVSVFDHPRGKGGASPGGFDFPADEPEAYDAQSFRSALGSAIGSASEPGGPSLVIAILGPLVALKEIRELVPTLVFVEAEPRLALLRWSDRLMAAGIPGGVEALLYYSSVIEPRYAQWSEESKRAAIAVLDDEDGPQLLASKIAWLVRGGSEAVPVPRTYSPLSPQSGEANSGARGVSLAELESLERRFTQNRPPPRWGVRVRDLNAHVIYPALKRALDIGLVATILLLAWPIFGLVALLIWIDDPGPVLFTQTRIGRYGRPFPFPKFRSMVRDADKLKDRLLAKNEMSGGITFKMKRDPRVLPIGRILRKYSLDELPQLYSVLRGDLTLVGPRPPVPREVALYRSADRRRLEAVPGLTCIWQVSGRSDIPFPRQVELDVQYLESRSLLLDLRLLLATIPAVITGKGAY